jgi:hypothetical protein
MAKKQCIEEFNPWPPFVDIFSSVILVLMLFLLIVVVNLGYYMQFNSKSNNIIEKETTEAYDRPQDKRVKELQREVQSLRQELKSKIEMERQEEKLQGEGSGNAVKRTKEEEFKGEQKIEKEDEDTIIVFDNTEIFITKAIKSKIIATAKSLLRQNPNGTLTLSVGDPKKVAGRTVAKRTSLGRVLNIKSMLKNSQIAPEKIKIKYRQKEKLDHDFGYIRMSIER